MSTNINQAQISGNLTQDAVLRSTPNAVSLAEFTVAVNERRRNSATGEWEDWANFLDCTVFGARAEKLADMLTKGTKVMLSGSLRQERWEKGGKVRSKIKIIVDDIEIIKKK